MELTLKDTHWKQYVLLILALWFFGLAAITLVTLMLAKEKNTDQQKGLSKAFLYIAVLMIAYGVGRNIAVFENANVTMCRDVIECLSAAVAP